MFGGFAALDGHGPRDANGVPKFQGALRGKQIWWVTRDFPTAQKIWRDLKGYLRKWGGPDIDISEVEKRIEFPGGGSLTIKSAHDPNALRGETLDGLIVDEAAFCHPDVWVLSLRPMLAVRQGWCIFISTPNGKNWFYDEWRKGAERVDPDYVSWRKASGDNPFLPRSEIEAARRTLGEFAFRREWMAEFEVRSGGMFREEWFRFFDEGPVTLIPDKGRPALKEELFIFITADFAGTVKTYADFTVIGTWGRSADGRLWLLDLWRGRLEAPAIAPLLQRIVKDLGIARVPIWVEASGPLVRVNAEAREYGLNIVEIPIHKENKDKVARNEPAAAAVEQGRVILRKGARWVSEFISECCSFPDKSTKDDQVDVLGHAVFASPPVPPPTMPNRPAPEPDDTPPWQGDDGEWDIMGGISW